MISIVIPTVTGREHWLERCLAAYERTTEDYEVITVIDQPSWGKGINEGVGQATGEYLHLSADDLEPHEGWWQAAMEAVESGIQPCPRILNTDGTLQSCGPDDQEHPDGYGSDVARIPFIPRQYTRDLFPMFDAHYMTDYWITWKLQHLGMPTVVVRDYLFTHHLAPEGRLDTLASDLELYKRATA